jgi:hypothetical protein
MPPRIEGENPEWWDSRGQMTMVLPVGPSFSLAGFQPGEKYVVSLAEGSANADGTTGSYSDPILGRT